jgi:uncharacterized protein involved in exopolysaccharide biosynthesis
MDRLSSHYSDEVRLPTLRDVATPVFRYRRIAALIFLGAVAATLVAAALPSRTYEAHMKILVKRERLDAIVSSERQSLSAAPIEISESELNSEVELLTSRDLLEQVAKASGLEAKDVNGIADPAARLDRTVRRLRGALQVEPIRKTTLILVTYRSPDPQLAARVLDQLSTLYLAKHLAVHRPAGAQQFFSDQAKRYHDELRGAEANLNAFVAREHVVNASGERETTLLKLAEFEAGLHQTDASIADTTRRLTALDAEIASTPTRQVTQVRDGGNLEVVRKLKAQILELEMKRTDLLQKFTPQYLPVVQLDTQLRELRDALADTQQSPLKDETTDQNPTYQWLRNERARVRTEGDALQARADATRRTIAEYETKARRLDAQNVDQQELIRAVKTAEENYQLYQRKQEEARISDELDRSRIANVALAEPPTVPQTSQSRRSLILLVGLFGATFCSLTAAYTLHALNPYFYTPDEVYRVLDVPVLASLPVAAE